VDRRLPRVALAGGLGLLLAAWPAAGLDLRPGDSVRLRPLYRADLRSVQ